MATLKNRRGNWYARVLWYLDGRKKERQVPLRTGSKVTARERLSEVNKVESDIKDGMNFTFPWMSDDPNTKVKRFTLEDASNQWIANRKDKMRKSTIEINELGLKYFIELHGKSLPLESVNNKHIDDYSDSLMDRGLSITTINIHLRTIKAMFRYYLKTGKLNKILFIEQISQKKTKPIYNIHYQG